MLSLIGGLVGIAYCLFVTLFRWTELTDRYGTLSLYWWVMAVTIGWSAVGFTAEMAIWAIQYAIWLATA